MLLGIVGAVIALYSGTSASENEAVNPEADIASVSAARPLLEAIPLDAAMILYSNAFKDGVGMMDDSTLVVGDLLSGDSRQFRTFVSEIGKLSENGPLRSMKRTGLAVSLHYSGSLTPLLVLDAGKAGADTTAAETALAEMADSMSLCFRTVDVRDCPESHLNNRKLAFVSPSESLIQSAARHLEGHVSVTGSEGFTSMAAPLGGDVLILLNNGYSSRLASSFLTRDFARKAGFIKEFSRWTGFSVTESGKKMFSASGSSSSDHNMGLLANVLSSLAPGTSSAADVLPSGVRFWYSVQTENVEACLQAYEKYLDAAGKLQKYNAGLKAAGRISGLTAGKWASSLDIKELAYAEIPVSEGYAPVTLLRPGKPDCGLMFGENVYRNLKDCSGKIAPSPYYRYPGAVFGDSFASEDSSAVYFRGWLVFGTPDALQSFVESASERTLSAMLSDSGTAGCLPKEAVFRAYYSVSAEPSKLSSMFGKNIAATAGHALEGISYCPVFFSVAPGEETTISLSIPRVQFAGSKDEVSALSRDTVVTVPSGPFKVKNSGTGRMNLFSQNANNYLVLKEEDGKGIWGVPFKTPICGAVIDIDYYGNGKRQFLFASGSSLYLIDRLGRFVNPFPVDLGKEILIGPSAYDFTGAHGYTVVVLHKDNSIGMYDLHGRSPSSWKGIRPENSVKSLPELLTVKGKKYWIVRTSVRTLIYPFEGGEPLTRADGDKMIRPDSGITVRKDGSVSALCYDGKERVLKL